MANRKRNIQMKFYVTEELKAYDPMRWVGLMNTLTTQIEEILIRELICS